MKLQLTNFKCWEKKEFDFDVNSFVLLSGTSGCGKSTILNAINWVLYGVGSKIITFGKTTCNVKLVYKKMVIERNKRPNYLVFNNKYRDDSAQSMINDVFGKSFDVSGYMTQNHTKSFVFMRPMEKLHFIEKIAFNDTDLSTQKQKCKTITRVKSDEIIAITSKMSVIKNMIDEVEKPPVIDFPISCRTGQRDRAIRNEKTLIKNSKIIIKKLSLKIQSLGKEKIDIETMDILKEHTENQLLTSNTRLTNKKDIIDSLDWKGVDYLKKSLIVMDKLIENREFTMIKNEFIVAEKKIETLEKVERSKLLNNIKQLSQSVWDEYSKDESTELIDDYNSAIRDLSMISTLTNSLKVIRCDSKTESDNDTRSMTSEVKLKESLIIKLRDARLRKKGMKCPGCKSFLFMENSNLRLLDFNTPDDNCAVDDIQKELKSSKKKLETLRLKIDTNMSNRRDKDRLSKHIEKISSQYGDDLPVLIDLREDLNYICEYIASNKKKVSDLTTLKRRLSDKNYSPSWELHKKGFDKLSRVYNSFNVDTDNLDQSYDEDELQSSITDQKIIQKEYTSLTESINTLVSDISICTQKSRDIENDHIVKWGKIENIHTINASIKKYNIKLEMYESKKLKHEAIVKRVEDWIVNDEKIKKWNALQTKYDDLQKKEALIVLEHTACLRFTKLVLEAESIAIKTVTQSINAFVQIWIDRFFQEDTMSISIKVWKEVKKSQKPQIHLHINYKGMQGLDVDSLSGGEKARVILAFTLAMSDMFALPLVMLDETTSNLDSELAGDVVRNMRTCEMANKTVIMVAHQIHTSSQFDQIINI